MNNKKDIKFIWMLFSLNFDLYQLLYAKGNNIVEAILKYFNKDWFHCLKMIPKSKFHGLESGSKTKVLGLWFKFQTTNQSTVAHLVAFYPIIRTRIQGEL